MHTVAARSAARIQEKGLPLLISVKYFIKFAEIMVSIRLETFAIRFGADQPMREKGSSSQQRMGLVASQSFKPIKERLIDPSGAELLNQFLVVDGLLLSVRGYGTLNVPWSDDLIMSIGCDRLYDRSTCRCRLRM